MQSTSSARACCACAPACVRVCVCVCDHEDISRDGIAFEKLGGCHQAEGQGQRPLGRGAAPAKTDTPRGVWGVSGNAEWLQQRVMKGRRRDKTGREGREARARGGSHQARQEDATFLGCFGAKGI